MPEPLFAIEGLGYAYPGRQALGDVSCVLDQGQFHGVVGPNGCGKTTLLDLMAGLRVPGAGSVRFMGRDAKTWPRRELAKRLALAPQEYDLSFAFSVEQTVLMGRHPHMGRFSAPGPADLEAVEHALAQVDALHLRERPVTALSGGEKQRVVLARTLAQSTDVLLLDEPTSRLDVNHALTALTAVEARVKAGGTAVAVLHDLGLAAAFCQRVILMNHGSIHAEGPAQEVLTGDNLAEVFGVKARVKWDDFAGARTVVFQKRSNRA